MPSLFGKSAKQAELLENLPMIFTKVQKQTQFPPGDFPEINHYRSILSEQDFDKFPKMYQKLLDRLEQAISEDLPQLMRDFPPGPNIPPQQIFNPYTNSNINPSFSLQKETPSFSSQNEAPNFSSQNEVSSFPLHKEIEQENEELDKLGEHEKTEFSPNAGDATHVKEERTDGIWTISRANEENFSKMFDNLRPIDGKISGNQAKIVFSEANLPNSDLAEIWQLADQDSDGALTLHEYIVMMKLVQVKMQGGAIPKTLPSQLRKK